MAGLCLAYLVSGFLIADFAYHAENYDLTLFLAVNWALDSILLFAVALTLRGLRQILIICLAVPLLFVQVFAIQYPDLFPQYVLDFAFQSASSYFIEVFIFVHSWKDNTVKEWLKTGSVWCLVLVPHIL